MLTAVLNTLPLALRARSERLRRALGDRVAGEGRTPAGAMLEAFPRLRESFDEARGLGLPMSMLAIRIGNFDRLAGRPGGLRRDIVAELSRAFGGEARVAPMTDNDFAVLLLGKDQCPELVGCVNYALERLSRDALDGSGLALVCQVGIARCPLDADDFDELITLASRATADLPPNAPDMCFVDRDHRLRCA